MCHFFVPALACNSEVRSPLMACDAVVYHTFQVSYLEHSFSVTSYYLDMVTLWNEILPVSVLFVISINH